MNDDDATGVPEDCAWSGRDEGARSDSSFSSTSSSDPSMLGSTLDIGSALSVREETSSCRAYLHTREDESPMTNASHAAVGEMRLRHQRPRKGGSQLPWQRKQLQRQLGESCGWQLLRARKETARGLTRLKAAADGKDDVGQSQPTACFPPTQGLDVRRMVLRVPHGPDRARLIHRMDVEAGYVAGTSPHGSAADGGHRVHLTAKVLPPIVERTTRDLRDKERTPVCCVVSPATRSFSSGAAAAAVAARFRMEEEARRMGFFAATAGAPVVSSPGVESLPSTSGDAPSMLPPQPSFVSQLNRHHSSVSLAKKHGTEIEGDPRDGVHGEVSSGVSAHASFASSASIERKRSKRSIAVPGTALADSVDLSRGDSSPFLFVAAPRSSGEQQRRKTLMHNEITIPLLELDVLLDSRSAEAEEGAERGAETRAIVLAHRGVEFDAMRTRAFDCWAPCRQASHGSSRHRTTLGAMLAQAEQRDRRQSEEPPASLDDSIGLKARCVPAPQLGIPPSLAEVPDDAPTSMMSTALLRRRHSVAIKSFVEANGASQMGAVDHFLFAAYQRPQLPQFLAPSSPSFGSGIDSDVSAAPPTLFPRADEPSLKPQLLAVVICVSAYPRETTALDFYGSEINARAVVSQLEQLGFQVTLLVNESATAQQVQMAIDDVLESAGKLHDEGNAARVVVYMAGRGIILDNNEGKKPFMICFDEAEAVFPRADAGQLTLSLSPDDIAGRVTRLSRPKPLSSALDATESLFQWEQPVVICDLRMLRIQPTHSGSAASTALNQKCGSDGGGGANELEGGSYEMHGVVLAHRVPGGSLRVTGSSRHCGILTYYWMHALQGVVRPTVWAVNMHIVEALRNRALPSLKIGFECPQEGLAARSSDLLTPLERVPLPAKQLRLARRNARLKEDCKFAMWCEVDATFTTNPQAFLTRLRRRIRVLVDRSSTALAAGGGQTPDEMNGEEVEPVPLVRLQIWGATPRQIARIYFPCHIQITGDSVRQEFMHLLGDCKGDKASDAQASFRISHFEWCRGDNCVVVYMPALADRNSVAAWMRKPSFIEYLTVDRSELVARSQTLRHARITLCISVSGAGCQCHVGRLFKHVRLGTLRVASCCNCTIERLIVTAAAQVDVVEEAEHAAMFVQKIVRRFLTRRIMRSRMAAASMILRQRRELVENLEAAWLHPMVQWHFDYQEEALIALESTAARVREETRAEEQLLRYAIFDSVLQSWQRTEALQRMQVDVEELAERQLVARTSIHIVDYANFLRDAQFTALYFGLLRGEKMGRHSIVAGEFGSRMQLRVSSKESAAKAHALAMARPSRKQLQRNSMSSCEGAAEASPKSKKGTDGRVRRRVHF